MQKAIAVAIISGFSLFSISAEALPIASAVSGPSPMLTQVAQGCGYNGHRGPYGHCRPRFSCPPGWHPGPYGEHCFRNR